MLSRVSSATPPQNKVSQAESSTFSHKFELEAEEERFIILIDMDAYYAQVEMKKHGIPESKPCAVQQWNSLIALNYAAKGAGVKRGMTCYDALAVVPDLILIHVATFEVIDEPVNEQRKQFWCNIEETNREKQVSEMETEPQPGGKMGFHNPPQKKI